MRISAIALAAAVVVLAGCSGGSKNDRTEAQPTVRGDVQKASPAPAATAPAAGKTQTYTGGGYTVTATGSHSRARRPRAGPDTPSAAWRCGCA